LLIKELKKYGETAPSWVHGVGEKKRRKQFGLKAEIRDYNTP
jgi:hypothetical protein